MQLSSKARKSVAVGLAISTFVWSVSLFALPAFVLAAPHSDGCLINSGGTISLVTGGQKRGFPSAEVFMSHGYTFSQVVAANSEDTQAVGPVMVYADGTLVKGPSDPLVYLVANGQKRGFVSGSVFTGLGFSFANIVSAAVNTFADLPVGANLESATERHTAGVLAKDSSGTVWKMTSTGRMGIPSMAVFDSYGYKWANVVTANAADLAAANEGVVAARATCSGGGTPPVSGALSVSLSASNPAAGTILADATNGGQAQIKFLQLNFTAGSSGSATVTTLKLKRGGVSSDSDISNVYLYDGEARLAEMTSISSGVVTFTSTSGLFTVPANSTRSIWVAVDVDDDATAGKVISLSLNSAADVILSGGSSVSGSFPLSGNNMTVAVVTDLGYAIVAALTNSTTVNPGTTGFEAMRFTVQANNQNMSLSSVKFTMLGSAAVGDLANFKLYDGSTQLGSTIATMNSDKTVQFDLSTALTINSGVTKTLSLKVDVVSGSTRTIQFSLQRTSDFKVMDLNYNVKVNAYTSVTGGSQTYSVQTGTQTTIQSGSFTVSKSTASPSGDVALGGTNVEIARFDVTATGEPIKMSSLDLHLQLADGGAGGGDPANLKNVKLVFDGVQVGTTQASVADNTDTTINVNFTIPVGTKTLSVFADMDSTATGGTDLESLDTILATLDVGQTGNGQGTNSLTSFTIPGSDVPAGTVTAKTGALTLAKNPSQGAITRVNGALNQVIGSFTITAGSSEGVDINQIVLTSDNGTLNNAATNSLGKAFSSLDLYNGTTKIANTITPSTSDAATTTYTFSVSPALSLNASQQVQIDVKANILSSPTWANGDAVEMDSATGTGKVTSTSVSASGANGAAGQAVTLASAGNLTVSLSGSAVDQQVVMGTTDVTLGTWKFEANNSENLDVNQIIVGTTTSVGGDIQNLKLFVSGSQVGSTVPALTSASSGTATFGSSASTLFSVLAGTSKDVVLKASVTAQDSATGNAAVTPKITEPATITGASADTIIARGQQSGQFATTTAASNTAYNAGGSYAYRTKLTATLNSASPSGTGKTRQANDTIFKMDLSANSAYQGQFRAAGQNSADASTSDFSGGLTTVGDWTVTTVGDDGSTLATDSANKVQGSASQQVTQGATTPVAGNGLKYTFTAANLSAFNGVAFWIRASNATPNLTLTLTGAGAGSHTVNPAANGEFEFVVVPFAGATTPFTGLTAVTAFDIVSATAYTAGDTVNIDSVYFYKDFLKANLAASANAVDEVLVTAKDNASGATFAAGYYDGTATAGSIYFIPTSDFTVDAGASAKTINLVTDTTALLSGAANLSINVDLGSSSSTVTSPGGVLWYDGKVTTSVPWVDSIPNPVQGGSLGY